MRESFDRYAIILLLSLFSAVVQQPAAAPAPGDPGYVAEDPDLARLIGMPGPSITLRTLDGRTIDLHDSYARKPIYLKLWATYCLPCRAQMPGFEKIYDAFSDRMQIISVNAGVGDDADKVRAFLTKFGTHIPVAIDDGSLGAWLKMEATPFHVLIGPLAVDSDGVAFRVFGIGRLPAVALIGADGRLVRIIGPDETDLADAVQKIASRK